MRIWSGGQNNSLNPLNPQVTSPARKAQTDPDAFEERAEIHAFDADMTRADAEDAAARAQGFTDAAAYRAALASAAPGYDPAADPDTLNPDAWA